MKYRARNLRKNQTDAEKLLWSYLRNRQMEGCKFRRQWPIGVYIVDFACLSHQLVIELDRGQHAEAIAYDETRTRFLAAKGYKVIRLWNNDMLAYPEAVLQQIYEEVSKEAEAPSPQPSLRERELSRYFSLNLCALIRERLSVVRYENCTSIKTAKSPSIPLFQRGIEGDLFYGKA